MISQWLSNRIETSKPVTQRYHWSCPHMLFQTHYLIVCDQTEHLTTMSHTSCLVLLLQEATSQSSLPCVLVETIHLEQGWLKGCLFHEVVFYFSRQVFPLLSSCYTLCLFRTGDICWAHCLLTHLPYPMSQARSKWVLRKYFNYPCVLYNALWQQISPILNCIYEYYEDYEFESKRGNCFLKE